MTTRAGAVVLATLFAVAARADSRFDFLFRPESAGDDTQLFLQLAVRDHGAERSALEPILPRIRHLDADLPVILLLSRHSGRPPAAVVELRSLGLEWQLIFGRLQVPLDVLFVGIDRDPGPPYGNAWGYWRKDPRGVRLSDDDVSGLVALQVAARLTGLGALELARERGQGRGMAVVVADRHGRPWTAKAKSAPGASGKGKKPGKKPKGKGGD